MQLSPDAIERLRAIYYAEFEREITREEAAEMSTRLIQLVQLLVRPLPTDTQEREGPSPL